MLEEIKKNLEKIAYEKSDPFCSQCYRKVTVTSRCEGNRVLSTIRDLRNRLGNIGVQLLHGYFAVFPQISLTVQALENGKTECSVTPLIIFL